LLHSRRSVSDPLFFLHRLSFTRGSEALDFVRTLRELSVAPARSELAGLGPILIYGARIVTPDAPAELYVSVGALTLAHALGMEALARRAPARPAGNELPADMALLFTSDNLPQQPLLP
jgi:hypothetical protein